MATESTTARRGVAILLIALRVVGAVLLAAMAAIHIYLYAIGYASVPIIGPLFLLNGIGAGVLTLAVLATPNRFLGIVAGLSTLFTAGTLGALVLSLGGTLFGFQESLSAPLVTTTLWVESVGVVLLAILTVLAFVVRSRTSRSESYSAVSQKGGASGGAPNASPFESL